MRRLFRVCTLATCLALGHTATQLVHATESVSNTSYPSQPALPDWSGWWGQGDSPTRSFVSHPPPLTEARRSQLSRRQPGAIGPGLYCRPAAFTGFNGNFVVNFEFLFTPGRVTITN